MHVSRQQWTRRVESHGFLSPARRSAEARRGSGKRRCRPRPRNPATSSGRHGSTTRCATGGAISNSLLSSMRARRWGDTSQRSQRRRVGESVGDHALVVVVGRRVDPVVEEPPAPGGSGAGVGAATVGTAGPRRCAHAGIRTLFRSGLGPVAGCPAVATRWPDADELPRSRAAGHPTRRARRSRSRGAAVCCLLCRRAWRCC